MTLSSGTRLGPYEITAKLGEGGMGEVFRARDTKLDREVAIKVLPERLAADPEALARFEREAKAVAALSHPNILAIFDFGKVGETAYAAMELLDGETLRERLGAGALPARKALETAAQMAAGLAAAHARGIVHRDLKPDNLFLTRDGQVKILDFGLARQAEIHGSKSQLLAAPTQGPGTEPGAVLGTVGYMAPEQVRGETADHRSDIFSLGLVLYEMLTGRRAFAHGSAVETMSAIQREEPAEIETLGEKFSPALARLVQHCLEKRPDDRFQSARDLAFDLRSLASGSSSSDRSGGPAVAPVAPASRSRRGLLTAALLIAGGVASGWIAASLLRSPAETATAALRPTFRQLTKLPGGEGKPSLAPDGESFVFVKRDGGDADLFLQRIDGAKAIPLTAECAENDIDPAFSPDGRSIAYRSDCGQGIYVIGATGESRRRVAEFGYQPAWSPDGRELAVVTERLESPTSRNSRSELWVIDVESARKRAISDHDAMGPTWSPDGKRIAFWGMKFGTFQRDLWSVAADGSTKGVGEVLALLDDAPLDWSPVHSRDGRWLYFDSTRGGTMNLWRLPLDPRTGSRTGDPEPVTAPSSSTGPASISADGRRLVFVDRNVDTAVLRASVDLDNLRLAGPVTEAFRGSFELREQKLSPDGEWILFVNEDLPQQMHLVRIDGTGYRQLTSGEDRNRQGAFSPDGARIVFQTSRDSAGLAVLDREGGGRTPLPDSDRHSTASWSADGSTIAAYHNEEGASLFDVRGGVENARRTKLEPIAAGVLFWPIDWAADDRIIAGRATRKGQTEEVVLYDVRNGGYRSISDSGGASEDFNLVFLDSRRIVYGIDRSTLWIHDVQGSAKRMLYESPSGRFVGGVSASADGRWLAWIERADESDIWLMTLDEKGESGEGAARSRP